MLSTFESENESLRGAGALSIRAIVPFLDEEVLLPPLLAQLLEGGVDRVVAVDGGSRDRSAAHARAIAHEVHACPDGLTAQLNLGAHGSAEDILFFVYADSVLPSRFRDTITSLLAERACVAGAFSLRLSAPSQRRERPLFRVIAGGANFRTRLGIGPFGDQGIFVRRSAFEAVGGFRSGPLCEDLDLVRRLRRLGSVRIARSPIETSPRRWERDGILRTTARHWWTLGRHLLGGTRSRAGRCAPDRLRTGGR